jgi:hypothetical protein
MPLPKKTVRVFPNPWAFVHHDHGPQGVCHRDTGGRGSNPEFIGAELDPVKTKITETRDAEKGDHRHARQVTAFRFPVLNATLDGPAEDAKDGIELPKSSAYYLDRLRDGDLVPADAATAQMPCRFKSLAEARDAAIANFDAHYDEGAFAEAFPDLAPKKMSGEGGNKPASDSTTTTTTTTAAPGGNADSGAPASTTTASEPSSAPSAGGSAGDDTSKGSRPKAAVKGADK